jgi:hypothetical protein
VCSSDLENEKLNERKRNISKDETERLVFRFHIQEQHDNWSLFDKAIAVNSLKRSSGLTVPEIATLIGIHKNLISEIN